MHARHRLKTALIIASIFFNWNVYAGIEDDVIANIQNGQYSDALALQSTAPVTKSTKGPAHKRVRRLNNKGLAYSRDNDFQSAVISFDKAYKLDPNDVEVVDNYAYILYRFGDNPKAAIISSRAISLNPMRSSSWGTYAQIQAALGNKEKSIAALDAAYIVSRNRQKTIEFLDRLKDAASSSESNPTLVAAIEDSISHHSQIDTSVNFPKAAHIAPASSKHAKIQQSSSSSNLTTNDGKNILFIPSIVLFLLTAGIAYRLKRFGGIKMSNKEQVKKYFDESEYWPFYLILIGIAALFAKYVMFGISLIVFGGAAIILMAQTIPTDSELDAILNSYVEKVKRLSLSKMGIDADDLIAESVHIIGVKWDPPSGVMTAFKVGNDKVARYTPVNLIVLHFAPDQLLTYECTLDLFTGNPLNASTDEYFYKDVVSISTKTKSISKNIPNIGQIQMDAAEIFTLSTSAGTSFEVFLRDPKLIDKLGGDLPTTLAERTIQSVRKVLREKKSG